MSPQTIFFIFLIFILYFCEFISSVCLSAGYGDCSGDCGFNSICVIIKNNCKCKVKNTFWATHNEIKNHKSLKKNEGKISLLSFERKSSKLPIPLTGAASLFRSANGTGIIYIFGGITTGGIISNKIISYIFSTGEINTLANLPSPAFGGSLLNDPLGNILYFGAKTMENKYDVYKFDPATKIVTIYGKYPAELELGSFTQYSSHFAYAKSQDFWGLYEVYIFEDSFRILKYAFGNMINLEKIKFQYDFNNGFLFVGRRNKKLKAIVADRSSSFDTKEINIPNKVLNNSVTIAWDGFKIYVLAGLFGKDLDEGNSTIGELVQLDPKTKTSQVYNINNYPAPVGKSFFGASAHFVQHLNTILVFGGTDGNKIMDNIWSIDLNPIP